VIFSAQETNYPLPFELPDFKISITVYESLLGLQPVMHDNSIPNPNPPSFGNFLNRFLPCYGAQVINNLFGDDDKAAITLTANLSALVTRHPVAIVTAGAVDLAASVRAGIACATIARRWIQ
jgi:hypothetical protein